jgi:mandelate racemase
MSKTVPAIRNVKARGVVVPLKRPVKNAFGVIDAGPLVLIDVETDQGVTGHAYIFAYTRLTLKPLVHLIEDIGRELTGRPVAPYDLMAAMDAKFRLLGWQGLVGMAVSGLDMAMWDALARSFDQPLATVLGGSVAPLPAYDSFGMVDAKKDQASIRASLDQGFKAIKIKIGGGSLDEDVATVSAVRSLIGPDIRLMVDYNQSLDPVEAGRRAARLEAFDLAWIEEPVAAEDLEGHARVRSASRIPVQTGENWWFPSDMQKAIAAGASDLAMIDVMKIGGVTGWLRAMGQAGAASLPLSSHIFVETSAHLLAVTPTAHWLEFLDVAGGVLSEQTAIIDGTVVARGPGLGLEWDERQIERLRR